MMSELQESRKNEKAPMNHNSKIADNCIENVIGIFQDSCNVTDDSKSFESDKPTIIHFFGSTSDEFYNGVSLYFARGAFENLIARESSPVSKAYNHVFVQCHPDGAWSFPASLDDNDLLTAPRVSFGSAITMINSLKPLAAMPHMFCVHGLTTIRGLFEMLGVPVIGNTSESMTLSTNKWQTRCVLEAAGVPVPKGELLRSSKENKSASIPCIDAPFVIKPCSEGNSLGLSLYKGDGQDELRAMINYAFKYDSEVLVEEYIELGYEIRVAVYEDENGHLNILPICNYVMQDSNPIRTLEDKLETNRDGVPTNLSKCQRELPAKSIPSDVIYNIEHYAKKAHVALKCRDYSIFDVRVSPDGTPYFIEASLYCSYASKSIIVLMSEVDGKQPFELFEIALKRAISRGKTDPWHVNEFGCRTNEKKIA